MSSNWASPTLITQYAETGFENDHVSWLEIDNFYSLKHNDSRHTKTTRELLHIARDPKHDILEKTYYLKLTGFTFTSIPNSLSGIQAVVRMNRGGRITDETVQLCLNSDIIGDNQATLDLNPIKTYGNETSLWGAGLTLSDVLDSTFGIVLRFKSHPKFPHRTSPLIDTVELRIY